MSAAWKARKANAAPADETPPKETDRLAAKAAAAIFGPGVLGPAPAAASGTPARKRRVGPGGKRVAALPVQDRFGGLADQSRGGPMGVRLTRVVNGDSGNRVFSAASGVQILHPRPLASQGDLRAVPPGQ
jgi:hypothetical protein